MMLDKMEKSKLMAKSFKQLTDKSFHAQSNITAYQKSTSLQRLEPVQNLLKMKRIKARENI